VAGTLLLNYRYPVLSRKLIECPRQQKVIKSDMHTRKKWRKGRFDCSIRAEKMNRNSRWPGCWTQKWEYKNDDGSKSKKHQSLLNSPPEESTTPYVRKRKYPRTPGNEVSVDGQTVIHINENLNLSSKMLLYFANTNRKSRNGIHSIWTKYGKLHFRKNQASAIIRRQRADDLERFIIGCKKSICPAVR